MTLSDENLARAAATGDRQAFSNLLERSYDRMFGLAFRLTGSRADAEDLTQDVCLALPAKLAAFRGESRFSTWLYRVVVNAAHDRRRRAASHCNAVSNWGDWERNRQASNAQAAEETDWLAHAMATLNDDLRDTLALLLGEEMTHAQAADVLNVSEGTISWRMSEAKKRLRALAEKENAQ